MLNFTDQNRVVTGIDDLMHCAFKPGGAVIQQRCVELAFMPVHQRETIGHFLREDVRRLFLLLRQDVNSEVRALSEVAEIGGAAERDVEHLRAEDCRSLLIGEVA